jgi:hypothetical protein
MPPDPRPGPGEFLLYPRIAPALVAGDYVVDATQSLRVGADATGFPVDAMAMHVRVRAPRFTLPPDQVLSTFPPAASEGNYGARLPQVVLKRRTLPWERRLAGADAAVPYLALVVIAEGEAEFLPNRPVAECVTPGVALPGIGDVETGNCLEIRQSAVERIFPTRKDVPLLAHARLVDISDTELMMGDDDGFLAVVVANRLPVSARDAGGAERPVRYMACLVNLEGQFDRLLATAPAPAPTFTLPLKQEAVALGPAGYDRHVMRAPSAAGVTRPKGAGAAVRPVVAETPRRAAQVQPLGFVRGDAAPMRERRRDFELPGLAIDPRVLDPVLRFPVLLHWEFTTVGSLDFETLVRDLDSGLLGTVPATAPAEEAGRLPLELVDTGHVGLVQRTRHGDAVRAWYRGPCLPHPADETAPRLALAHTADQLRIVVPDGREDLSLASAFEIGRLLALAQPNVVAALQRWRQLQFAVVHRTTTWQPHRRFLDAMTAGAMAVRTRGGDGVRLGRVLADGIAGRPERFLGQPLDEIGAGRPLPVEGAAETVLARAFALPVSALRGDAVQVAVALRARPPVAAPFALREEAGVARVMHDAIARTLDLRVARLVEGVRTTMPRPDVAVPKRRGGARTTARDARTTRDAPDALDALIAAAERRATDAPDEEETP